MERSRFTAQRTTWALAAWWRLGSGLRDFPGITWSTPCQGPSGAEVGAPAPSIWVACLSLSPEPAYWAFKGTVSQKHTSAAAQQCRTVLKKSMCGGGGGVGGGGQACELLCSLLHLRAVRCARAYMQKRLCPVRPQLVVVLVVVGC